MYQLIATLLQYNQCVCVCSIRFLSQHVVEDKITEMSELASHIIFIFCARGWIYRESRLEWHSRWHLSISLLWNVLIVFSKLNTSNDSAGHCKVENHAFYQNVMWERDFTWADMPLPALSLKYIVMLVSKIKNGITQYG